MAVSIGIEPMRRFHVHGLANRCINHSANLPKWWRGKDLNLQTTKGADLQSAVITIRQPLQNGGAEGLEPALFTVGQYRCSLPIAYTPENGTPNRI